MQAPVSFLDAGASFLREFAAVLDVAKSLPHALVSPG
jgi:hypothetical protein